MLLACPFFKCWFVIFRNFKHIKEAGWRKKNNIDLEPYSALNRWRMYDWFFFLFIFSFHFWEKMNVVKCWTSKYWNEFLYVYKSEAEVIDFAKNNLYTLHQVLLKGNNENLTTITTSESYKLTEILLDIKKSSLKLVVPIFTHFYNI